MGLGRQQSSPNWLQPAPGPGPSLPSPPQFLHLPPWGRRQGPTPPCHATRAPAHCATSSQRRGSGQTLPVPRHLSNPLALVSAGSVSSAPHPDPPLMWHSWQRGLARCCQGTLALRCGRSHILLRITASVRDFDKPIATVHTQCQCGGDPRCVPQIIPRAMEPHSPPLKSLPTLYVPSSCTVSLRDSLALGFSCTPSPKLNVPLISSPIHYLQPPWFLTQEFH